MMLDGFLNVFTMFSAQFSDDDFRKKIAENSETSFFRSGSLSKYMGARARQELTRPCDKEEILLRQQGVRVRQEPTRPCA